jgi:signal peptidase II
MAQARGPDGVSQMRLYGPWSGVGLAAALATFAADQLSKYWLLHVQGLAEGQLLPVTPFLNLTLLWNKGVSYGLFTQGAQWPLILFSLLVCAVLWSWLSQATGRVGALALGLIIGGALGNSLDRVVHGGVTDFLHFYWGNFSWYVFNVADAAIVAGVGLLLYDSLRDSDGSKGLGNA